MVIYIQTWTAAYLLAMRALCQYQHNMVHSDFHMSDSHGSEMISALETITCIFIEHHETD